jgi:hypothetical protein
MTQAADFLAPSFKQRTKIGAGLYQFSYGRRGWVTLQLKVSGDEKGKWHYTACRHNDFYSIECDGKTFEFGQGPVQRIAEDGYYKTMKDALEAGQYCLLERDEKNVLDAEQRVETARVLAVVEAQLAANEVIFARLRAEGKIK